MTGFDLPSLQGFDLSQIQNMGQNMGPNIGSVGPGGQAGEAGLGPTGEITVQGPEGLGKLPVPGKRRISGVAPRFEGVLADSLAKVQALQDDVRMKTRGLALGEDVELHDVLIASGKSEVAFNLLLEVRNKLVDAWEKLSRSSV